LVRKTSTQASRHGLGTGSDAAGQKQAQDDAGAACLSVRKLEMKPPLSQT
jgi:hypothetical protein